MGEQPLVRYRVPGREGGLPSRLLAAGVYGVEQHAESQKLADLHPSTKSADKGAADVRYGILGAAERC